MKSNSTSHNKRGSERVQICFHNTGIFQNLLGLQSKNTQILCNEQLFQTLFQKQNPGFKTSKSSKSSRHPDGVGADAGCILDMLLIQAF